MSGLDQKGTHFPNGIDVDQGELFIGDVAVTASAADLNRITGTLTGSLVFDPASLATVTGAISSGITVTGAALGDYVLVSAPYDLAGVIAHAYVSAANTVKIALFNATAGTVDLASGTWKVLVMKG